MAIIKFVTFLHQIRHTDDMEYPEENEFSDSSTENIDQNGRNLNKSKQALSKENEENADYQACH